MYAAVISLILGRVFVFRIPQVTKESVIDLGSATCSILLASRIEASLPVFRQG